MKPYYIHILGIIFCLASCTPHSKHWETLMQVESFMEERPDNALTVLQELDKEDLSGKEEHAKYALLLSMAMDLSNSLRLMNRSMPGLPVHQQLPEFTQIHLHRVSDVIQPSHPLPSPSPPDPNPSQHQSLFQ